MSTPDTVSTSDTVSTPDAGTGPTAAAIPDGPGTPDEHATDGQTRTRPPLRRASPWAAGLAAMVASAPLWVTITRLVILRPPVWLWGDQALTDIASFDVYRGRMFLGPYSRFGWHHPGPAWFAFLGVFRAIGGGSATGLLAGYLIGDALAVMLTVVVVWRWLGPRSGWVMAALLAAFQWSFTFSRLASLWNPYAVALPALLLIVVCARLATAEDPWPSALGALVLVSVLVQTDISTSIVVVALVAGAVATRVVVALWRRRHPLPPPDTDPPVRRPWPRGWAARAVVAVAVVGALWALPIYQQVAQRPGNFSQLTSFFAAGNTSGDHGFDSVRAMDTVLSAFPFRVDEAPQVTDSTQIAVTGHSLKTHPVLVVYAVVAIGLGALALRRRDRMRAALAGATVLAMAAGTVSAFVANGPLFPYLVEWMQPFVIPVWLLAIDAGADAVADARRRGRGQSRGRHRAPATPRPLGPWWAVAVACIVSAASAAATLSYGPASATTVDIARQAWDVAGPAISRPSVHRVLVVPGTPGQAPVAEGIADQALRIGKQVSVPDQYLYLFDPSFRDNGRADTEVIVGTGPGYPLGGPGTTLAGYASGVPILVRHRAGS